MYLSRILSTGTCCLDIGPPHASHTCTSVLSNSGAKFGMDLGGHSWV